jgi:pimeloyl-ACP methyl ester carboxylesterase
MVDDELLLVVGCSMGGSCALEMARLAPDRIVALALVAAKAGHRPDPAMRDRYIDSLETAGVMRLWPDVLGNLVGEQADRSVIRKIKLLVSQQTTDDLIRAVSVFHGRADLSDVVTNWNKPLLVMYGDRDRIVTKSKATDLAKSAPHAQLRAMHGCGHYMNMERPKRFNQIGHYMNMERPKRFNQIIGDFVRAVENSI